MKPLIEGLLGLASGLTIVALLAKAASVAIYDPGTLCDVIGHRRARGFKTYRVRVQRPSAFVAVRDLGAVCLIEGTNDFVLVEPVRWDCRRCGLPDVESN